MKLTGRVALITNISHFLGLAITEELCREGASVALQDRNEAAAKPFRVIAERLGLTGTTQKTENLIDSTRTPSDWS